MMDKAAPGLPNSERVRFTSAKSQEPVSFPKISDGRIQLASLRLTVNLAGGEPVRIRDILLFGIWIRAEHAGRWSEANVSNARNAARAFFRFLLSCNHRIRTPRDLTAKLMGEWHDWICTKSGFKQNTIESYYIALRAALRAAHRYRAKEFSANFSVPKLDYSTVNAALPETSRTPYDAATLERIKTAARADIEATVARLNHGLKLLRQGCPPGLTAAGQEHARVADGYWTIPNLLWWFVNNCGQQILTQFRGRISPSKDVRRFYHAVVNHRARTGEQGGTRYLFSLLYPSLADLTAFAIALFSSGVPDNIKTVFEMKVGDLKKINGRVYALLTKTRPYPKQYVARLKGADAILETLLDVTAPLREIAPPDLKDRVWIYCGGYKGIKAVESQPWLIEYVRRWGNRHGFPDGEIQLSRFRPTHASEDYIRTGRLGAPKATLRHARSDTTVLYVNNEATKEIHETAIENAQRKAFSTLTKPTVIDTTDARLVAALRRELGLTPTQSEALVQGRSDLFFNSCKDFFNRPDGPKDTPCDRPFACFWCANSIYLRRHAVVLIALLGHFERRRDDEVEEIWNRKYREPYLRIKESILPQFSPATLAAAAARAQQLRFYIPKELQ